MSIDERAMIVTESVRDHRPVWYVTRNIRFYRGTRIKRPRDMFYSELAVWNEIFLHDGPIKFRASSRLRKAA